MGEFCGVGTLGEKLKDLLVGLRSFEAMIAKMLVNRVEKLQRCLMKSHNGSDPKGYSKSYYSPLDVGSVFEETVKNVVGQRGLKCEGHYRGSVREGFRVLLPFFMLADNIFFFCLICSRDLTSLRIFFGRPPETNRL
jgi:hypothetical protein